MKYDVRRSTVCTRYIDYSITAGDPSLRPIDRYAVSLMPGDYAFCIWKCDLLGYGYSPEKKSDYVVRLGLYKDGAIPKSADFKKVADTNIWHVAGFFKDDPFLNQLQGNRITDYISSAKSYPYGTVIDDCFIARDILPATTKRDNFGIYICSQNDNVSAIEIRCDIDRCERENIWDTDVLTYQSDNWEWKYKSIEECLRSDESTEMNVGYVDWSGGCVYTGNLDSFSTMTSIDLKPDRYYFYLFLQPKIRKLDGVLIEEKEVCGYGLQSSSAHKNRASFQFDKYLSLGSSYAGLMTCKDKIEAENSFLPAVIARNASLGFYDITDKNLSVRIITDLYNQDKNSLYKHYTPDGNCDGFEVRIAEQKRIKR